MTWPSWMARTSAAASRPVRYGSSPSASGRRPPSGARAMSTAGPSSTFAPVSRASSATAVPYSAARPSSKVAARASDAGNAVTLPGPRMRWDRRRTAGPGCRDGPPPRSRGRPGRPSPRRSSWPAAGRRARLPHSMWLALDRAGGQTFDDPAVEEQVEQQRRDGDEQDVGEQQVVLGVELALEVEHRQLHGGVLVPGQEVEGVGEVVEDGHRLHDDHGHHDRPQQREDDPEEEAGRAGPVEEGCLVEVTGDGGDERPEQQDAERQPEGDLDEDEARQGLEQPQL